MWMFYLLTLISGKMFSMISALVSFSTPTPLSFVRALTQEGFLPPRSTLCRRCFLRAAVFL